MSNHKGRADYDERKRARLNRLAARAEKLSSEASATWERGRKMADVIPLGQPVMIGHHSEKRDRNYRARIDGTFRKASKLMDKAKEATYRSTAAEKNRAISSDDPDAVELLREKLDQMAAKLKRMKAANKALRSGGVEAVVAFGLPRVLVEEATAPRPNTGRIPGCIYEPYELSNLGANIRRLHERIESLERLAATSFGELRYSGARIIDDVAENRIRIHFDMIPPEEVRASLKRQGFKWSKYAGAWLRLRNNSALAAARYVLETGAAAERYCQAVPFNLPSPQISDLGGTEGGLIIAESSPRATFDPITFAIDLPSLEF